MIEYKQVAGVLCSATGTVLADLSMNEVLYTISLVLTIVGTLWTLVIWPIIQWYRKSKANDGKIDADEIKEGLEILNDGIEKTKDKLDDTINK